MPRFLDLSSHDQRLTIEQTAARNGWAPSSVEKDFWVCWSLQQLFSVPELAPPLTFKGGTSLSKAWGLIDRFSEDIDLTIGRDALGFCGANTSHFSINFNAISHRYSVVRQPAPARQRRPRRGLKPTTLLARRVPALPRIQGCGHDPARWQSVGGLPDVERFKPLTFVDRCGFLKFFVAGCGFLRIFAARL